MTEKWYLIRCFEVLILGHLADTILCEVFLMLTHSIVTEALASLGTTLIPTEPHIVQSIFILQLRTLSVVLILP